MVENLSEILNRNKDQFNSIKNEYKNKNISNNKPELASLTNKLLTKAQKSSFEEMGVSDKTLKDLTKVLNDSNNCDSECKKQRKLNDTKDILQLAMQILNGAPSYFDVSLKNYLIEKDTKAGYVKKIVKDSTDVIDNFIKNQEKINTNIQDLIKNMIYNYSYNVQYLENTDNTLKNSKNNLSNVDNKISKYTNLVNLDKRTNYFLSNDIRNLRNYNFYITIIYYILLVIILLIKKFFTKYKISSNLSDIFSKTNIILTIILFVLIFLPIILKKGIILLIKYYKYFLQYMNIQKYTKSYSDIIEADQ